MPTSPLFLVPMLEGGSDYPSPDAVADAKQINDQFKYAEQFWGIKFVTSGTRPSSPKNQQLIFETDTGKTLFWNGTVWVNTRDNLTGTASARDTYYGTPANAAARVALANSIARWYNTDKGWEEQYFAQYDDAGVATTTPTKAVFGWAPVAHNGLVPIRKFTGSVSAGTGTKKGGVYEFTNAPIVRLDGLFTADFENYVVDIQIDTTSTDAGMFMRLRASNADVGASAYFSSAVRVSLAGAVSAVNGNAVSDIQVSEAGAAGGEATVTLKSPFETKRTYFDSEGIASPANMWRVSGFTTNSSSCDGFAIQTGGAPTMNGRIRVYGRNRM